MYRYWCIGVLSIGLFACSADEVGRQDQIMDLGVQDVDTGVADANTAADSSSTGQAKPCLSQRISANEEEILIQCGDAKATLRPQISASGVWYSADECAYQPPSFTCRYGEMGSLTFNIDGNIFRPMFTASTALSLDGIRMVADCQVRGSHAWLSNGFQSWSQSGVVQVQPEVAESTIYQATRARSEIEVIRDGTGNAWWHTFVAAETSVVYGALSADVLKTWFTVTGDENSVQIIAHSQGIDESIQLTAGEIIDLESLYFELVDEINDGLERYGRALPSRAETSAQPELGWNSWYELWDTVDEAAIRDNAALARQYLTERLPANQRRLRLVIDDGWQNGWGNWTANDKFPSGLETLATDLKEMGFETGIWLAPLLVDEDESLVAEHPDWFVPETTYVHLEHGAMKVLDVTHPDAARHLKETIARIVGSGFDLLKIDFLFVGTFEGQRYAEVTAMQAYRRALELIREAAGPDTVLLSVGSPPIAGFDLIDSWRVGPDVAVGAFDASWFFVPNVGRTIAARWPYCLNTLCDGDPPVLRKLERNEVETSIWAAAFAGGALFLSDDLRQLEPARVDWLESGALELALSGQPAIPDPVPADVPYSLTSALADQLSMASRHAVPSRWRLPDGRTISVNWTDNAVMTSDGVLEPRSVSGIAPAAENR
ncbi:MAG: glycoside hydrolase family 36 protein [Bradymonadia bacterium]